MENSTFKTEIDQFAENFCEECATRFLIGSFWRSFTLSDITVKFKRVETCFHTEQKYVRNGIRETLTHVSSGDSYLETLCQTRKGISLTIAVLIVQSLLRIPSLAYLLILQVVGFHLETRKIPVKACWW